jgi:alkane 1-monooxygenase
MVAYPTFKVEHIYGHHVWAATDRDPSTAPLGQSLYRFLRRALLQNPLNGFRLQSERLRRTGTSAISIHNELLWWFLLTLTFATASFLFAGPKGLLYFVGQASIAIASLESLNYVEHYGLKRRRMQDGQLEPIGPNHSWNATEFLSNLLLINVQFHADHHLNPKRPYADLHYIEGSPRLPMGYPGMLILSLIPPLWRRIMDPLAVQQTNTTQEMTEVHTNGR